MVQVIGSWMEIRLLLSTRYILTWCRQCYCGGRPKRHSLVCFGSARSAAGERTPPSNSRTVAGGGGSAGNGGGDAAEGGGVAAAATSRLPLSELVPDRRFNDDTILRSLIYFPIGIVLVVFRLFTGICVWLLSALSPEVSVLRSLIANFTCFSLGIHVKCTGERDDKSRLIVANAVSIFDSLALNVSTNSISPSKWDLPPPLAWALGIRHLGSYSTNDQFREAVRKRFADIPSIPIFVQPEGCPTSGKGILKFSEWPFTLYDKVQPAAIEVKRSFGNVTTGSLSHWVNDGIAWYDLFWFMWNPYTSFNIHLLPVIEKSDNETSEEFANRTQKTIADFLKIEATEYSNNELRDLVSAREVEQIRLTTTNNTMRNRLTTSPSIHPDLQRMAAQVKEILPAVPLSVITKDLGRTQNIDVTLTNILEGVVPYTPEEVCEPTRDASPGPSQPSNPSPPLRTAAATFQRTAHDRQLSYQERKAQLIEAARRRYIEKHGLKNC